MYRGGYYYVWGKPGGKSGALVIFVDVECRDGLRTPSRGEREREGGRYTARAFSFFNENFEQPAGVAGPRPRETR